MLPIPFQPILGKEYADILQIQFNKRYSLPPGRQKEPSCEPYTAEYWLDDSLQDMKQELNTVKSKLNNLQLNKWHRHTKRMNPAGMITQALRSQVKPELLTQAWEKFHECFHTFKLGPKRNAEGDFNTLHLCEAPGAFVTSLNHAMVSSSPDTCWNWVATTLNPHYEGNSMGFMINDDRFLLGCLDHWEFGVDNTGNLLDIKNVEKIKERCKDLGDIHLVTADGSFDCQGDPAKQETLVSVLLESEIYTALSVLSEGGSFVIKMFTMFESETVCMMYLLSICFDQVDVFKPATSKEGNSEVYVVCRDFKRVPWVDKYLSGVKDMYGNFPDEKALFSREDIPDSFIEEIKKSANLFFQLQENAIENNLHYFQDPMNAGDLKDLAEIQRQVAEHYIETFGVEEIPNYRQVVFNRSDPLISQLDRRLEQGSFLERQAAPHMNTEDKLISIRKTMKSFKAKGRLRFVEWVTAPKLAACLDTPVYGKKVTTIQSSKFCTGQHLNMYNQTIQLLQDLDAELEPEAKRKKLAKEKPYTGTVQPLEDCIEGSKMINKINKVFPDLKGKTKVLSLCVPSEEGRRNVIQMELEAKNLIKLIDTLINGVSAVNNGDNLIIEKTPILTRISVAIFFCVAVLFEEIGFVRPYGDDRAIILSGFMVKKEASAVNDSIANLEKILNQILEKTDKGQVLSVCPIQDLTQDPIYSEMVLYNQLSLKEQILYSTRFLEKPPPGQELQAENKDD